MKYKTPLMHKLLPFLLIFILPNALFSQSTITGQIKDQNNKPVELIEVQLQNKDSIIVKSELTTAEGKFEITAQNDTYILTIKNLGKKLYQQKMELNANINLGTITIAQKPTQLKEVVLTTQKKLIERKVDRLVFNVENSIISTGSNALDALKKTPTISVQDNTINMIGKNKMAVMIDDRIMQFSGIDLISYLKGIASDNIKSIEVIFTPPAKYDAQGNSGIVNIKLKKVKSNSWSANVGSSYIQKIYPSTTFDGNFNYQKNKLSAYTSLSNGNYIDYEFADEKIDYAQELWFENTKSKNRTINNNWNIGLEYKFTSKLKIGAQYTVGKAERNEKLFNLATFSNTNTNYMLQYINTNSENPNNRKNYSLNSHVIYEIDTLGRKISLDWDLFNNQIVDEKTLNSNNFDYSNQLLPNSFYANRNKGINDFENQSFKLDIEWPSKWADFSFGGKISNSQNNSNTLFYNSTTGFDIIDLNQSNEFKYSEKINALYFSTSKKIGQKWETQIGLRMEDTKTNSYSITLNLFTTTNYTKLFPTFYLLYTHNDNNTFSLNYSKRIQRPQYFTLNPFRNYDNPYSYSEGNPFLQPSLTHNFEFTYTNKNWNHKLYYSKIIEDTGNLNQLDPITHIRKSRFENFFTSNTWGFNETLNFSPYKWWESYNSLNTGYNYIQSNSNITNPINEGFSFDFNTNNTLQLNTDKSLFLNLSYFITPLSVYGVLKMKPVSGLGITLKILLFNKNWECNIGVDDLFNTNVNGYVYYANNIKIDYIKYRNERCFNFSVNYKFGNKNLSLKQRRVGNREEKNRAN